MQIVFKHSTADLIVDDYVIEATSDVRNELNSRRPIHRDDGDVFRITKADGSVGVPSMPRPFPGGLWNITRIIEHKSEADKLKGYLYPYFIATDACQELEQWALTADGQYDKPTGIMVKDYGYGLHWAEKSKTTVGCIRLYSLADLSFLVNKIQAALKNKEAVTLKVEA